MKKSLWRGAEDLGLPMMGQSQKSKVSKQEVQKQTIPEVACSLNQGRALPDSPVGP